MKLLLIFLTIITMATANKYGKVKITPDISYVLIYHKGKSVKIHRIQDTKHRLTGDYAKISRPCPGQCIQPINMGDGVETIGEIEVVKFIKEKVNPSKGLLIDVREKSLYDKETIPSAVNIPYSIHTNEKALDKLFTTFGMTKKGDSTWSSKGALELIFYCNGLWCDKSSKFIHTFVERGYPADKIKYYRGGFQMWKILGFTTIKAKKRVSNEKR